MFNQISGFGGGFRGMQRPGFGGAFGQGGFGGPGGPGGPGRGRGGRFRAKLREGIQNGTITREEAQQLRAQKQQMMQLKQSASADGQITAEERSQLRSYGQQMRQMFQSFTQA